MSFVGPLLFLMVATGGLAVAFNKPFQRVLPITLLGSIVWLYIFGLINLLMVGFWTLLVMPLGLVGLAIWRMRKNRRGVQVIWSQVLLTPGAVLFLAFYVFLFFLTLNRGYQEWDDMLFWGPQVKEMLRLGTLYDVPESLAAMHKDYPPGPQLFRFLFCELGGGYNEHLCFLANQLFAYGLLVSLFSFAWHRLPLGKSLAYIALILFTPLFFILALPYQNLFDSTLVDAPLGVLGGFGLYLASVYRFDHSPNATLALGWLAKRWCNSKYSGGGRDSELKSRFASNRSFSLIQLVLTAVTLTLFKPTGIFFVGLMTLVLLVKFVLSPRTVQKSTALSSSNASGVLGKFRQTITLLLVVALPLLSLVIWQLRVSGYGNQGQGVLSFSSVFEILTGNMKEWQAESQQIFTNRILNEALVTLNGGIGLTYWMILIIFAIFALVASAVYLDRVTSISWFFTVAVGGTLYGIMMRIVYQTQFGEGEAVELASYDRYMMTFPLALLVTSILLLCNYLVTSTPVGNNSNRPTKKIKKISQPQVILEKYLPAVLGFVSIVLMFITLPGYYWGFLVPPADNHYVSKQFEPAGNLIMANTELGSNVYIVSEKGYDQVWIDYHVFEHNNTNNFDNSSIWGNHSIDAAISGKSIGNNQALTAEDQVLGVDLINWWEASEVEYVYISNVDQYFVDTYAELFPEFGIQKLYRLADSKFELVAALA